VIEWLDYVRWDHANPTCLRSPSPWSAPPWPLVTLRAPHANNARDGGRDEPAAFLAALGRGTRAGAGFRLAEERHGARGSSAGTNRLAEPPKPGAGRGLGRYPPKLEWLRVRQQGTQSCPNPE